MMASLQLVDNCDCGKIARFMSHLRQLVHRIHSIQPIERNPGMKQIFSWHVHGDRKFEVAPRSLCREISLGGRLLEREPSKC